VGIGGCCEGWKVCAGIVMCDWLLVYEVERLAPESYWAEVVVGGMVALSVELPKCS